METVKLDKMYVPTLRNPSGPLVVMTAGPRPVTALQMVAKPVRAVAERVVKTVMECKKVALLITSALLIKLTAIGKSLLKYVKRDFLKKEGIPLKGLVIYKGSVKGMGKMSGSGL